MDRFAFLPPTSSYGHKDHPGKLAWFPRFSPNKQNGVTPLTHDNCIPGLFLQCGDASHLIVLFHANAEDIGYSLPQLQGLRKHLKCHVLALEYAGYGLCTGTPGFDQIISDCDSALQFVRFHFLFLV